MTTTTTDYFAVLGLDRETATLADAKRAYRKLARQHHPDTNNSDPAAAETFRLITEAYERVCARIRIRNRARKTTGANGQQTTGNTGVTIQDEPDEAISRILTILEDTWQAIRATQPQIPAVIIIIGSGTGGRETKWGHYAPHRWATGNGTRAEILISGEGLQRGARDVLATLLHEAAHALAAARGIKDTSRQGRYHNKHFKALAEELGLTVTDHPSIGWSITTLTPDAEQHYARHLAKLHAALSLWRYAEQTAQRTGTRTSNLIAAACPCGRSIRIAASTLDAAPVICGACTGTFQPKERS